MEIRTATTCRVDIYLAGDIDIIKQACRQHCYRVGLCVIVTPCSFIYTGGQEEGVCVGLVNYPRFPTTPERLLETAKALALELMDAACQHSVLIESPAKTEWLCRRDENPVAK